MENYPGAEANSQLSILTSPFSIQKSFLLYYKTHHFFFSNPIIFRIFVF